MANEIENIRLKATDGIFEVRGVIFGMKSEKAFKEFDTKNKKPMRIANIGLRISDSETMYLSLNGMVQEFVTFTKSVPNEKPLVEKVAWDKVKSFKKEGFRMMGIGLALHKNEETGKNEEVKIMTQYDAIEYIKENLVDGASVYVKGKIEHGSFEDTATKEVRKTTKFVPNGIYLNGVGIDFQNKETVKHAEFAQTLVFKEAVKREDKFFINCAIVGYNSYEEIEIEASEELATQMKNRLKPFNSITVTGVIKSVQDVETVTSEVWGESSTVGKAKSSGKTAIYATGARGETVNTETYAKKILAEYEEQILNIKKEKASKSASFETQNSDGEDWGKGKKSSDPAW